MKKKFFRSKWFTWINIHTHSVWHTQMLVWNLVEDDDELIDVEVVRPSAVDLLQLFI